MKIKQNATNMLNKSLIIRYYDDINFATHCYSGYYGKVNFHL